MRERKMDAVIDQYASMVYRIVKARVGPSGMADDVFQNVFLAYLTRSPDFKDAAHEKAWLIRVACNCSHDLWRKTKHELPMDILEEQVEAKEGALLERLDLLSCLEDLRPEARSLIHLFYYEEMSSKDIAALHEKKEGAVRMALSRARAALKRCLEGGQKA